jgi:sulfur-carrier protein adenylyltransferase/sulfurtransferase
VLVDLPAALLPSDYPRQAQTVASVIRKQRPQAERLLRSVLRPNARPFVLLTAPTENGPALAALRMSAPNVKDVRGRRVDVVQKGFRPGKIAPHLQMLRFLQAAPEPERLEVKRADAAWIHGRGRNPQAAQLAKRKVAVLGIGSVGSFVAEHLAAAGVGDLTLIDNETLTFANAGRYILGVDSEGLDKAIAVAELLQRRFPHHCIRGKNVSAQTFLREQGNKLCEFDLLLSLTGDWEVDSLLNDLYLDPSQSPQAVLFGWAEAHAVAGHAVLLSGTNGCLLCHTSDNGLPSLRVAEWKQATTLSEPVCGGVFQPYGPVEIASVNSMIGSLALEFLAGKVSGNVHRVYASDDISIQEAAGEVTQEWIRHRGTIPGTARITLTLGWDREPGCKHCGAINAD